MTAVKICGIRDDAAYKAAVDAGASYAGFVFVPESTRYITPDDAAPIAARGGIKRVGLFTDPDDASLQHVLERVTLDMIQLHGHETPARVAAVKSLTGLAVIKAIPVAEPSDLGVVTDYEAVADMLLFDAKIGNTYGGLGRSFDWTILEDFTHKKPLKKPWMLAGGLNAENVTDAIKRLNPDVVDVSSGVESAPTVKDPSKIVAFVDTVRCT